MPPLIQGTKWAHGMVGPPRPCSGCREAWLPPWQSGPQMGDLPPSLPWGPLPGQSRPHTHPEAELLGTHAPRGLLTATSAPAQGLPTATLRLPPGPKAPVHPDAPQCPVSDMFLPSPQPGPLGHPVPSAEPRPAHRADQAPPSASWQIAKPARRPPRARGVRTGQGWSLALSFAPQI